MNKIQRAIRFLRISGETLFAPSCYPEKKRKKLFSRIGDLVSWAIENHEPHAFYNIYGLDLVDSSPEQFLDYKTFTRGRNQIEATDSQSWTDLRNKYQFYLHLKREGIPTPEVFAVIENGNVYDAEMHEVGWAYLEKQKDYFVKDIDGECGSFVEHVEGANDLLRLKAKLMAGRYVVQRRLVQNPEMAAIYSGGINTYRIVTVYNNGQPYVLTSLLRIGTKRSGKVDNWARGGLAIGIAENGFLKDRAFYKPQYGSVAFCHPDDEQVVFAQVKAPQFERAKQLACRAHESFPDVETIGWDVAISESGPAFIEGNDNWEISLMQAADRPLKEEWTNIITKKSV